MIRERHMRQNAHGVMIKHQSRVEYRERERKSNVLPGREYTHTYPLIITGAPICQTQQETQFLQTRTNGIKYIIITFDIIIESR